jgi:CTP synthase
VEDFEDKEKRKEIFKERHRHRYEVNNEYKDMLQKAGFIISGTSPDGKLAEIIEFSQTVHPLFMGFIRASLQNKK